MPERIIHVALTGNQTFIIGLALDFLEQNAHITTSVKQEMDAIAKAIQAGKFRVN